MSTENETQQWAPSEFEQLLTLIDRGNRGDVSVLDQLKRALDQFPEVTRKLGDLVAHSEEALLTLAAGSNLAAREAIARRLAELRVKLTPSAATELEKLLVERVVLCWLEVHQAGLDVSARLLHGQEAAPATRAAQQRLSRSHARFLSAAKALATVGKLLKPVPSAYEVAMKAGQPSNLGKREQRVSRPDLAAAAN